MADKESSVTLCSWHKVMIEIRFNVAIICSFGLLTLFIVTLSMRIGFYSRN